ncbi:MAG: hypothetical protein HKN51_17535 [Saprospiraceae bacterium]|nr:hypothetical protein [Saprospiraceae bacterium]
MKKSIIIGIAFFAFIVSGKSQQIDSTVDSLNLKTTVINLSAEEENFEEHTTFEDNSSQGSDSASSFQTSRYFFNESAYGLKKGQKMYQNIMGLINTYSYGFSDNFTFNFSTEFVSLFEGRAPIILLSPKYTFQTKKSNIRLGLGANYAFSFSGGESAVGSLYGLMTIGKPNNNLTLGIGYLYSTDDGFEGEPIFQVSASLPINEKFVFVFDANFAVEGEVVGIFSPSLRYIRGNATFDLTFTQVSFYGNAVAPLVGASFLF